MSNQGYDGSRAFAAPRVRMPAIAAQRLLEQGAAAQMSSASTALREQRLELLLRRADAMMQALKRLRAENPDSAEASVALAERFAISAAGGWAYRYSWRSGASAALAARQSAVPAATDTLSLGAASQGGAAALRIDAPGSLGAGSQGAGSPGAGDAAEDAARILSLASGARDAAEDEEERDGVAARLTAAATEGGAAALGAAFAGAPPPAASAAIPPAIPAATGGTSLGAAATGGAGATPPLPLPLPAPPLLRMYVVEAPLVAPEPPPPVSVAAAGAAALGGGSVAAQLSGPAEARGTGALLVSARDAALELRRGAGAERLEIASVGALSLRLDPALARSPDDIAFSRTEDALLLDFGGGDSLAILGLGNAGAAFLQIEDRVWALSEGPASRGADVLV